MRLRPPGIDRYEVPPGVDPAAWRRLRAEDRRVRARRPSTAELVWVLIGVDVLTTINLSLLGLFPRTIYTGAHILYVMPLFLFYGGVNALLLRWVSRSRSTLETVAATCCAVASLAPAGALGAAVVLARLHELRAEATERGAVWWPTPFTSRYPENLSQVVPGVTAFCVAAAVALVVTAVVGERRRRAALRQEASAGDEPGCGTVASCAGRGG